MRTLLAEEGAAPQDVEGAVLSSVVPSLTQVAVQAAEALTRRPVRVLGRDLDPGLPTGDYDASNLGMDRLVDCVAALARWRPPLAVFDMGTATTLSVVDRAVSYTHLLHGPLHRQPLPFRGEDQRHLRQPPVLSELKKTGAP